MLPAVLRAGIYARISSDREGDQAGVRRQVEDCERLAERRGWEVVGRYVDDDVSAFSGRVRPAYRELCDDIESGAVTAVVVWHVDRLHRRPRDLEDFLDLCDRVGLRDLESVSGEIDLGTEDGRLMARLLGAFASKESADKSRRIRRKHEELAKEGRIAGGGTRPFGFEQDRVMVRESEAVVIRDLAERFLAGESLRSLTLDLNDRGIATSTGGQWSTQTLSRMLRSARISGQREHRGEIVAPAQWEAIITPAQTARIRAILADPARRTNRQARRYLLAGMLRCGRCGEPLVARPRQDGQRRYVCTRDVERVGCGRLAVVADPLEQLVCEGVLDRLDSPELAAALRGESQSDPEAARWQSAVDDARGQLDELAGAYAQKAITMSEWLTARRQIEERLSTARKELARATRVTVLADYVGAGEALRGRWEQLTLSRQRAIIAAVIDHLVVAPSQNVGLNRFDESRVTPIWRA